MNCGQIKNPVGYLRRTGCVLTSWSLTQGAVGSKKNLQKFCHRIQYLGKIQMFFTADKLYSSLLLM